MSNAFQVEGDDKLEIVEVKLAQWCSDESVSIDFAVGYLLPDSSTKPLKPENEAEAIILEGALPLKPSVLSRHRLCFPQVMRLDVFDTESRFAGKLSGAWEKFRALRSDIPGIAISQSSNYLNAMEDSDIMWNDDYEIFHTHVSTFGSCVINILSWDRPEIIDYNGSNYAH